MFNFSEVVVVLSSNRAVLTLSKGLDYVCDLKTIFPLQPCRSGPLFCPRLLHLTGICADLLYFKHHLTVFKKIVHSHKATSVFIWF